MVTKTGNKGIALFITIALLFLLSLGAIVVLLTAYNYANISENQIKRLKALSAAEAGINYAYWKLRKDPVYTGSTITVGSGIDSVSVVITITGPVSGVYTIKSSVVY